MMRIKLSRRQRMELVSLFYELKIEGDPLAWAKTFNRSRLALGLTPIMTLLTNQKRINGALVDDAVFVHEIERATADLLLGPVASAVKRPAQIVLLSDLFEAVGAEESPAADLPPYDKASENWAAPEDEVGDLLARAVAAARAAKLGDAALFAKLQETLNPVA